MLAASVNRKAVGDRLRESGLYLSAAAHWLADAVRETLGQFLRRWEGEDPSIAGSWITKVTASSADPSVLANATLVVLTALPFTEGTRAWFACLNGSCVPAFHVTKASLLRGGEPWPRHVAQWLDEALPAAAFVHGPPRRTRPSSLEVRAEETRPSMPVTS